MAGPAELMSVVSRVTGLSVATVTDIDRRLVKAGLRTKSGRGRNAAVMTALDAARLLAAMLGSPQANNAAEAVQRYAATRVDRERSSAPLFGAVGLDDLAKLPVRHSFVDGLQTVITSAVSGSLAALMGSLPDDRHARIEVFALTRATHGQIRLTGMPNGNTASLHYGPAAPRGPMRESGAAAMGDLEQSRRISERTIYAVAACLTLKENEHDFD